MISFGAPHSLVECIESLLRWNPARRTSAKDLLLVIERLKDDTGSHPTRPAATARISRSSQPQQYDSSPQPGHSHNTTQPRQETDAASLAPSYYSRADPPSQLPQYNDVTNPSDLGDYFARVLAGGALITATTDELRAYFDRTPRLSRCRVVQCIRRSENQGVRHEFALVQCALGSDKGKVWLRLERLERTNRDSPGSKANDAVSSLSQVPILLLWKIA